MIQILHHVAFACTDMCARMFESLVLQMQCWVKDYWILHTRCWSPLLSWLSENQKGEVMLKSDYGGTVFDAVDTDCNSDVE